MNSNLNSQLAFSILILAVIQVSGQSSYSVSIFKNPTGSSVTSFSAEGKQLVHTPMTGYRSHWKEDRRWFQPVSLKFYGSYVVQSGFTFNPSSLAGGRIFFYNPLQPPPKEPNYQYLSSSKTQRSEFPNLYRVSGLASYNQNIIPKLNIWLPQKTELTTSQQVIGALLYTALNVYGTWNQQMINNPIMNPNFTLIKP